MLFRAFYPLHISSPWLLSTHWVQDSVPGIEQDRQVPISLGNFRNTVVNFVCQHKWANGYQVTGDIVFLGCLVGSLRKRLASESVDLKRRSILIRINRHHPTLWDPIFWCFCFVSFFVIPFKKKIKECQIHFLFLSRDIYLFLLPSDTPPDPKG